MSGLKRHHIVTHYVTEEVNDGLATGYTDPLEVAYHFWRNWWMYHDATAPLVVTVTVDGHTFTLDEIVTWGRNH